ncbi:MAG: hypothetical protein KGJ98_09730 [Chloroflexota bacterium]|nr:hypothetical protein [Chloroflexota bacterium]
MGVSGRRATAVLLAGAILGACSAPGGQATAASGAPAASAATTAQASKVDPNATIHIRCQNDSTTLDPALGTAPYVADIVAPAYEPLIHMGNDGSYQPGLATKWEYTDNGGVLELTLRSGVKFSDGTAFNAAAVKANIERGKTIPKSGVAAELGAITTVDAVNDTTVDLHLKPGQGGTLLESLTSLPGMMVSPAAFSNKDLAQHPVGTGPFTLASYKPGVSITYQRNESYWGTKALAAKVEIDFIGDATAALNALRTGAVDMMGGSDCGLSGPELATAKSTSGISVQKLPVGLFVQNIMIDRSKPPLSIDKVREAMNYAFDRAAIVKTLGYGTPTVQYAPRGTVYFDKSIDGYYTYDVAKAKQLLTEAGYPNGFAMKIAYNGLNKQLGQITQILQQYLQAVGIKATLEPLDGPALRTTCFTNGKCDSLSGAESNRVDTANEAARLFAATGSTNLGNVAPPADVQQLMNAAQEPTTDAEHVKRVQALSAQLVKDGMNIPLFNVDTYVESRAGTSAPYGIYSYPDYAKLSKDKQ